jgi:arylsulfate sulfotransferase
LLPAVFVLAACGGGGDGGGDAERPDFACATVMDPAELGSTLGLTKNANIWLNPNGTTPLSARLQFCTPEPGTVKLTVLGRPSLGTTNGQPNCGIPDGIEISHEFTESVSNFDLPILGLYADHDNTVRVDFVADSGATTRDELIIRTGPIIDPDPEKWPQFPLNIEIEQNLLPEVSAGVPDSGVYIFAGQKAAFDQCGEVRWIYQGGTGQQFFELLPNGNWLGTSTLNELPISYHLKGFAEFTMLGEVVPEREYGIENYLHHEVQKLPWGNYLVASNFGLISGGIDGVTQEDTVLEVDAETGLVVRTWDFNRILDPTRQPIDASNTNSEDWLHLNSAVYDESDRSIVITAQRQSLIAKVGYGAGELGEPGEPGELIWIIAPDINWDDAFPGKDKLLRPVNELGDPVDVNAEYFWPYGPHAALVYPDRPGVVAVFDNGLERGILGDRATLGQNPDSPDQDFSRGVEYQVDLGTMTVKIVWQFDFDKRVYNSITGDIDYLPNGNYLLGFVGRTPNCLCDNPRVMEVDIDGNILFNALSNRGEIEYRVEKIDLYYGSSSTAAF